MNLILGIDFKFKDGTESNMIIEFMELSETPEYLEDVYFLPIKNYLVSDSVVARVYFNYDAEKKDSYEALFDNAVKSLSFKENGNGHSGLH